MRSVLHRFTSSEFLKNVATLLTATGLAQAISLAIYPVLSRIYTPEEHGLFALYLSIITLTAIISTGKYELAIMIPKKEKDGAGLTLLGILLSFAFSLLLLVFIAFFHDRIPGWFGNPLLEKWLWYIPLSTFLVAVFQSLSYWSNRKSEYRAIGGANLTQSVVNSAVKLSASKTLLHGGGLITGAIAGQLIGAVVFAGRHFRKGFRQFREVTLADLKALAVQHSFFPRYSMLHKLINNFSSSLPVFVFTRWFDPAVAGFFGLGFMLINRPLNLLSTSFSRVFAQRIIAMHNDGRRIGEDVKKFVWRMAALAAGPTLLIIAAGPWLVRIIFGSNWHEAGVYMQIFAPWLFVVFLSAPVNFIADMVSRQRKAMLLEVIKLILRVGALGAGVVTGDVYLALGLYSGFSLVVVGYSLVWYLHLARRADEGKASPGEAVPGAPPREGGSPKNGSTDKKSTNGQ